jgi:hypothetical protein
MKEGDNSVSFARGKQVNSITQSARGTNAGAVEPLE